MFSFLFAFFALYLSLNALNLGIKHARKTQLANQSATESIPSHFSKHEAELYIFLSSTDAKDIFNKSHSLFQKAIKKAQENEEVGHLYDSTGFSANLYHYTIHLSIEPSSITWEVSDNIQTSSSLSKRVFYMHYDRSQQKVTEDEVRLNKGTKYYFCSLREMSKYVDLPLNFKELFDRLNNAGWNKISKDEQDINTVGRATRKTDHYLTSCTEITDILTANRGAIHSEIEAKITSIVSVIRKICGSEIGNEEHINAHDNELLHSISRLLEQELPTILHIYLQLDEIRQEETKEMTLATLEKTLNSLSHQFAQFQHRQIQLLKQTQIVMNQRYEI